MGLFRLLKNDIARESIEWVKEDIISGEQADAICQYYGVDRHQLANHFSAYNILIKLGCICIGVALIILLSANWQDIPRVTRMGGLIGLTMLVHGVGLWRCQQGNEGSANMFFFVGCWFYGAAIILIAQIYHLGEHMPDGVYWWALGCLPLALLRMNIGLMSMALLLALLWFGMEIYMGFYPLTFFVFIVAALWVLVQKQQSIWLFLITIFAVVYWFEGSLAYVWRAEGREVSFIIEQIPCSVALGLFAYACSQWLGQMDSVKARDYAAVLSLWTLRLGLLLMVVLSYVGPWRSMLAHEWQDGVSMIALILVMLAGAFGLLWKSDRLLPLAMIVLVYLLLLVTVAFTRQPDYAVYLQIASNVLLIGSGIWLIFVGLRKGVSYYFFLGIVVIVLTLLLRYIDLIGDYIGSAILFIVFAGLLLGAAFYWKNVQIKELGKG